MRHHRRTKCRRPDWSTILLVEYRRRSAPRIDGPSGMTYASGGNMKPTVFATASLMNCKANSGMQAAQVCQRRSTPLGSP